MRRKRRVLVFIIMAFVPQIVWGAIYYVDANNGNDLGNGLSPSSAWKTIAKVNNSWSLIQSGDDIVFKRGAIFADATLIIDKGGTQSNPMIIGAYGSGPAPIIDCGPNKLKGAVYCNKPNLGYITVQDLTIKNVNGGQSILFEGENLSHITISRVKINGNADRNGILLTRINTYTIEDCTISNCGNCGIAIIGTPSYPITNGIIRNNIIHDIKFNDGITLHKDDQGNDVGPNHQILDNLLYNCAEQGLDITSGNNIVARRNETYHNAEGGVLVDHGVSNVWIDKHYSHDDKFAIILSHSANVKLTSSIIFNTSTQSLLISNSETFEAYNNTFVHGSGSSIIDIDAGANSIMFKNNIITSKFPAKPDRLIRYLNGMTPANTNSSFDYNIWWLSSPPDNRLFWDGINLLSFDGWKSIWGHEAHSLFLDPRLMDHLNKNFHLQATSPAIDAGANVGIESDFEGNSIPKGSAPDIGAYECVKLVYASINASPSSGQVPLNVSFQGNATGRYRPFTYKWNFGDGQYSNAQNASHIYSLVGNYIAILMVTDSRGNDDSTSVTIAAYKKHTLSLAIVTGAPAIGQGGITNPSSGTHSFIEGESIKISAMPSQNYRFAFWNGDVSSSDIYKETMTVIINQDKSLTANFCSRCGDVNGDLKITPSDAQRAFDIFLQRTANPTYCEKENADVNCNGRKVAPDVTPEDARYIFDKYLGKNELPCNCSAMTRAAAIKLRGFSFSTSSIILNDVIMSNNEEIVIIPIIIESSSPIDAFGFDLLFPQELVDFIQLESKDNLGHYQRLDANRIGNGLLRVGGYKSKSIANQEMGRFIVVISLVFKLKNLAKTIKASSLSIISTYDDIRNAIIRDSKIFRKIEQNKNPTRKTDRKRIQG